MPEYIYKARDRHGELMTGTLEGQQESDVITHLDRMGYSVLSVEPRSATAFSLKGLKERLVKGVDKQETILFTRQLSTLIRAGTALAPALNTIYEQTTNMVFKAILEDVHKSVQGGTSFSEALGKYPHVFPELFVSMIEVGETAGMLDSVLDRLATLGTQELEMSSRIRAAMVYPIVLVLIAFAVVNFLVIVIIPKFVTVFESADAELPMPTQIVIGMSQLFSNVWFWCLMVPAIVGFGMWFRSYMKTENGRFRVHKMFLGTPVFGPLMRKIQITRFARILSSLLSSGIPILQALAVVEKTVTNVVLRRAIQNVRIAIGEGHTLADPFRLSGLFSPMVIQMISTGEKTGRLDMMLEEIGAFYDPEIDYTVKNMTSLLEPLMLLIMGGMVGFIALSVLLPIFNLISVFKK